MVAYTSLFKLSFFSNMVAFSRSSMLAISSLVFQRVPRGSLRMTGNETLVRSCFINFPTMLQTGIFQLSGVRYGKTARVVSNRRDPLKPTSNPLIMFYSIMLSTDSSDSSSIASFSSTSSPWSRYPYCINYLIISSAPYSSSSSSSSSSYCSF